MRETKYDILELRDTDFVIYYRHMCDKYCSLYRYIGKVPKIILTNEFWYHEGYHTGCLGECKIIKNNTNLYHGIIYDEQLLKYFKKITENSTPITSDGTENIIFNHEVDL